MSSGFADDTRDAQSAPSAGDTHRPTILVIEDDPIIQMQMAATLHANEFACIIAETIEEGWSALQQGGVSLVISDFQVDALRLIAWMRADQSAASIPVIIASGELRSERRQAALDAGASRFLTKPFAYTDLIGHVRQCLTDRLA